MKPPFRRCLLGEDQVTRSVFVVDDDDGLYPPQCRQPPGSTESNLVIFATYWVRPGRTRSPRVPFSMNHWSQAVLLQTAYRINGLPRAATFQRSIRAASRTTATSLRGWWSAHGWESPADVFPPAERGVVGPDDGVMPDSAAMRASAVDQDAEPSRPG